jgi:hypothetical protein
LPGVSFTEKERKEKRKKERKKERKLGCNETEKKEQIIIDRSLFLASDILL